MDQERGHPHLLLWYVSGDLDPVNARETEAHLAHCRECTAEAKALASMLENLKQGLPGELSEMTARGRSYDVPHGLGRRFPAVHEHGQPTARKWKRRLPALAACAVVFTILMIAIPALVSTPEKPVRQSSAREAESVVLAPLQRGEGNPKIIAGDGPWAISVILPFGAPSGIYELRLEAVDQPAEPLVNASLSADIEGRLSLIVESLPTPGRFVLSVRPRGEAAATPYIYAFQTVAGAADGA